ncbi:1-acyl-sn-glycerol-3-phosphate acyltransferase [Marivirga harenae]|uniref:1-acyl-sn-glycerol-3-phosphate acyltransferase n=1 Tax=Marivirga harenae TaxID=2010992 RepID=UPI0026DEC4E9|nr:1-acyl-sn-glycerol-3-phosphate acyltransferase [Marivirga harenae]WKV10926.1 1-acyl-sn-glycerol-3-phosphate acyltransferase [Marivirga harenae]|tara:strand:- start:214033 stop:215718 length:1686 start_codon:yes stop_codon:yes gene_type:complete
MKLKRYRSKRKYDPILPGPREWPVVQLSRNRKEFLKEVAEEAYGRIKNNTRTKTALIEELETTLYKEKARIRQNPWKVDPDDEHQFWGKVKNELLEISQQKAKDEEKANKILYDIIERYADEIAGNFNTSHYRFARGIATFGFNRLLNAARVKKLGGFWSNELTMNDKIQINGEAEKLRTLAKKGTVVIVPTHSSNLDSILIGWVIYTLGLPPVIYGAGLNLFNISIISYFMNSLGAYKVDRRKRNLIYLETLKSYSALALKKGCQSLFFPGGTRSRDGRVEKELKLGLLGTAIEAQRSNYEEFGENAEKIFIVPASLNYHFVLEAPSLIRQYLEKQGQERYYVENDEFSSSYKIITFLFKFFTKGSDISVSIGEPMDILGNKVDDDGRSFDTTGREIHPKDYFTFQDKITVNKQREAEYTRMLSKKIVEQYSKIARVFSSHLIAFTAFEMIRKRNKKLDLFALLRLPEEDLVITFSEFRTVCQRIKNKIEERISEGRMSQAEHMNDKIDNIIEHGLLNLGMYHSKRPLIKTKEGDITTMDMNLLYFYRNRLDGYGLEKHI